MTKIFSIVFGLTVALSAYAGADDDYGMVLVSKGNVSIVSKGGTRAAKAGDKVLSGDTVTTGPDSRAKIVMAKSKNVLNLSPDSKVIINKAEENGTKGARNVELSVVYGKLRASVEQKYDGEKNKFNVRTPSAVAGVRGTDFITSYNPSTQKSQVITFHGVVAFGAPGPGGTIANPVFVRPGQMTSIDSGSAAEVPKPMPKDELTKADGESQAAPPIAANNPPPAENGPGKDAKADDKKVDKRGTASVPQGPAMVDSADLGPELSKDININKGPAAAPGFIPPKVPMMQPPPTNSFINGALQNQNVKVKVIVNSPNQ